MAEATPDRRALREEARGIGIEQKPGKDWAKKLLDSVNARMSDMSQDYTSVAREAGLKKEDLAVLKARFEKANSDLESMDDQRDPLMEKLEKLQDPDNPWKKFNFSNKINEMRIRRAARNLNRFDAGVAGAKTRAIVAGSAYEQVSQQLASLDERRLRRSESMTQVLESTMRTVDERLSPVNQHIEKLEGIMRSHEERVNTASERMESLQLIRRQALAGANPAEVQRVEAVRESFRAQAKESQKLLRDIMLQLKAAYATRDRIEADRAVIRAGIDSIAARYAVMVTKPDATAPVAPPVEPLAAVRARRPGPDAGPATATGGADVNAMLAALYPDVRPNADDIAQALAEDFGQKIDADGLGAYVTEAELTMPAADADVSAWRETLQSLYEANSDFRLPVDNARGTRTSEAMISSIVDAAVVNRGLNA